MFDDSTKKEVYITDKNVLLKALSNLLQHLTSYLSVAVKTAEVAGALSSHEVSYCCRELVTSDSVDFASCVLYFV
jgi:hypothetical protein